MKECRGMKVKEERNGGRRGEGRKVEEGRKE